MAAGTPGKGLMVPLIGVFSPVPVTSPANADPALTPMTEALHSNAATNVFFMLSP